MKRLLILFFLLLAIPSLSLARTITITPVYVPVDQNDLVLYSDVRYQFLTDCEQYKWKSSDHCVVFFGPGMFEAIFPGKSTLTGTPKDPSLDTITLNVNVPSFTYNQKNFEIDTPDGAIFEYSFNDMGILSMSTEGNCFELEKIEHEEGISAPNQLHIIPKKAGSGKIKFSFNGTNFHVNITVKKSAIPTPTPSPSPTPTPLYSEEAVSSFISSVAHSIYGDSSKSSAFVQDGGYIFFSHKVPRGGNPTTIRASATSHALDVLRHLCTSTEFEQVSFSEINFKIYADLTDEDGNTDEYNVFSFWIPYDVFQSVDWHTLEAVEILDYAIKVYEDPVMKHDHSPEPTPVEVYSDETKAAMQELVSIGASIRTYSGITTGSVNLREEPNSSSKKLDTIPAGTELIVLNPYYTEKWHHVMYDWQMGYISANYIDVYDYEK